MLNGKYYDSGDKELVELCQKAHRLSQLYNETSETQETKRKEIMNELLPHKGANCSLQGPVQFDYGVFTSIGDNFFANFNFVVIDVCPVTIGDNCVIGAGSVVTRDIPANSLAAGNPCRVIRTIHE